MVNLTESEKELLAKYPKKEMSQLEFDNLKEYSLSAPTQDSSGLGVKEWKRRTPLSASYEDAVWFYGFIESGMTVYHHLIIKHT